MDASENWKMVVGYPSYLVSRDGQVWSRFSNRLLNQVSMKGYFAVGVRNENGRKMRRVHTLVAEAFVGERPQGKQCAHLDGNKQNNKADNLAWVTPQENERHKHAHGTATIGQRSPHAKLSDRQAALVRIATQRNLKRRELAELLMVSEQIIEGIVDGQTYRTAA